MISEPGDDAHFQGMALLMRMLRSPEPHQLPECVELWPCHSFLHSRASGFSACLFQQCLFTLSCSFTIIVIKSRTLGAAVQIFTFICNGAAYSSEHLWDVRQRGFGTVFFNI